MAVSLVADLVVVVGELAEAGAVWVADDGLPATPQLAARGRVEVLRAPRLHDDRAEQTMVRLLPRVAVAVERVRSLLGIVRDSPFVDDGLAGGSDRIGVVEGELAEAGAVWVADEDRKSTRLNSSHRCISYAVFCLKKKNK